MFPGRHVSEHRNTVRGVSSICSPEVQEAHHDRPYHCPWPEASPTLAHTALRSLGTDSLRSENAGDGRTLAVKSLIKRGRGAPYVGVACAHLLAGDRRERRRSRPGASQPRAQWLSTALVVGVGQTPDPFTARLGTTSVHSALQVHLLVSRSEPRPSWSARHRPVSTSSVRRYPSGDGAPLSRGAHKRHSNHCCVLRSEGCGLANRSRRLNKRHRPE